MRGLLIASMLLAAPVPALAQDVECDGEQTGLGAAAEDLADPARQEQVGTMAGAMMEAIMDMPVGSMLRAAATMAGRDAEEIDPDTRLADVAGEDMADAPAEMAERLPQMMGAMAGMAGTLEEMLPQLRQMAETMGRNLPRPE